MSTSAAITLESLRARIREIEGFSPILRQREPSGLATLDVIVGGLPRPGLVELVGAPGSGRSRVAAAIAVERIARRLSVAWVDGDAALHPPGLARLGVDLDQVLVVRPPADGTEAIAWSAEQLLRSGCFGLVVVASSRLAGHSLGRAAEHGRCTGLILSRAPARDLPADLRLAVADERLTVLRDRSGHAGAEAALPDWPEEADPWA